MYSIIENVLGVKIAEAGMKKLEIKPCLDGLEYAKSTVPTPFDTVSVEHRKDALGDIYTSVTALKKTEISYMGCKKSNHFKYSYFCSYISKLIKKH